MSSELLFWFHDSYIWTHYAASNNHKSKAKLNLGLTCRSCTWAMMCTVMEGSGLIDNLDHLRITNLRRNHDPWAFLFFTAIGNIGHRSWALNVRPCALQCYAIARNHSLSGVSVSRIWASPSELFTPVFKHCVWEVFLANVVNLNVTLRR